MKSAVICCLVIALGVANAGIVGIERSDIVGPSGSIHREQPVHIEHSPAIGEVVVHQPAAKVIYHAPEHVAYSYPLSHPHAYSYPYAPALAYSYPHNYPYHHPIGSVYYRSYYGEPHYVKTVAF